MKQDEPDLRQCIILIEKRFQDKSATAQLMANILLFIRNHLRQQGINKSLQEMTVDEIIETVDLMQGR